MDKENAAFRIILLFRNLAGVACLIVKITEPNVNNMLKSTNEMFTITLLPVRG